MIFCQDVIDEYKRAMMMDDTGTMQEMIRRVNNAKKFGILTKNPSLVASSNLFVISEEVARSIESELGGRLSDPVVREKTVKIGSIPVTIDIKTNPNHKSTDVNAPDFLKRIGEAVADKEVSPVRIYLGVGIAVVSLIAAIVVVYAGVRNSVISIGRNPMSKKSIFRALLEVILTALLIVIVGLFAVYLLLKL
jgi:hypothetical protein